VCMPWCACPVRVLACVMRVSVCACVICVWCAVPVPCDLRVVCVQVRVRLPVA
ncbi:hypothetical protein KI387_005983, partial [Taxus chinensis]